MIGSPVIVFSRSARRPVIRVVIPVSIVWAVVRAVMVMISGSIPPRGAMMNDRGRGATTSIVGNNRNDRDNGSHRDIPGTSSVIAAAVTIAATHSKAEPKAIRES